jgi:hypothetical protein
MTILIDVPVLGEAPCPDCGHPAMFAWDDAMDVIALRPAPDPDGTFTLTEDANRIPWCRPVPEGTQLAFDDVRYSLHACPLAPVIPLTSAKPRRHPVTGGRRASAR